MFSLKESVFYLMHTTNAMNIITLVFGVWIIEVWIDIFVKVGNKLFRVFISSHQMEIFEQ